MTTKTTKTKYAYQKGNTIKTIETVHPPEFIERQNNIDKLVTLDKKTTIKQLVENGTFPLPEKHKFNEETNSFEMKTMLEQYTDQDITKEEYNNFQSQQRESEYIAEADPLFFQQERGKRDRQMWLDKIEEIENKYPYM